MSKINILDCTLRDGGYINKWEFDRFNSKRIINALANSNVEIIECGYLKDDVKFDKETTIFSSIEEAEYSLQLVDDRMYTIMINQGEVDVKKISPMSMESKISAIRVAFKKSKIDEAFKDIKVLVEKGYKVFVQPMVTLSYSYEELLDLVDRCNKSNVYAVYIVDSFGAMKSSDVKRLLYVMEYNLSTKITLGFHAHNNLQLAYTNSLEFIKCIKEFAQKERNIIVDSSIFGMGRGAGNLPTELIMVYLNDNYNCNYVIDPILDIIDKYINKVYLSHPWGYSIAYYLSGVFNCHPNYSSYLLNKETLTVSNIENILRNLNIDKKNEFDKNYIEKVYIDFNSIKGIEGDVSCFKKDILNKDIYILGPGKSVKESLDRIEKIDRENSIIISLNHYSEYIKADYYFFSNQKRYSTYKEVVETKGIYDQDNKFIITSNIKNDEKNILSINYQNILSENELIKDNATIMILNFLKDINIKEVFLVGIDGYSKESYIDSNMELEWSLSKFKNVNEAIKSEISKLNEEIRIFFITPSLYSEEII